VHFVHHVVMVHHMVMHHVVMAHHMVMVHHVMVVHAGEGRNRDHREGDAGDHGGEGLDQEALHRVSDPEIRRICR
jgi:hypothetical protein